jgi:UDP-2,4-diacetamido-2,4,6-trideoxy-beta-L-altropyranose hydrolase
MPQLVVFRVDASNQIGIGHVMRCITLAEVLSKAGTKCLFLSRLFTGNLVDLVRGKGYEVITLPLPETAQVHVDGEPSHSHWRGVSVEVDAQQTKEAIAGLVVDWLVVDHYGLWKPWEIEMRAHCRNIFVIDDLADREHDCDLLLDQNSGRASKDYIKLVNSSATLLIGPCYAMLRPEFSSLRTESLSRRFRPEFKRLLVTMGGVDKENFTGRVLDALMSAALPGNMRITVVMGLHAPWVTEVRAQALTMTRPTEVLVGVSNMARLMTDCDLAIGAAGSTTWERCCLGLPTIQLVLAENQVQAATAVVAQGAALGIPCESSISIELPKLIRKIDDDKRILVELAEHASRICNGSGIADTIAQFENRSRNNELGK